MAANVARHGPRDELGVQCDSEENERKWKTERQMRKGWMVVMREPFYLAGFHRLLAGGLAASA